MCTICLKLMLPNDHADRDKIINLYSNQATKKMNTKMKTSACMDADVSNPIETAYSSPVMSAVKNDIQQNRV